LTNLLLNANWFRDLLGQQQQQGTAGQAAKFASQQETAPNLQDGKMAAYDADRTLSMLHLLSSSVRHSCPQGPKALSHISQTTTTKATAA
jgi:hypothetical protein